MSTRPTVSLTNLRLSLTDLLGKEYVQAVCEARAFMEGNDISSLLAIAEDPLSDATPDFAIQFSVRSSNRRSTP